MADHNHAQKTGLPWLENYESFREGHSLEHRFSGNEIEIRMKIANHRSQAVVSGEIMSSASPLARIPTRIDDHSREEPCET